MRVRGLTVACFTPLTSGRSRFGALAQYMNRLESPKSISPSSFDFCVVLDVALSAEPADFKWLVVVVMVSVCGFGSALFAGLRVRVVLACCRSGEDTLSIVGVVGVSVVSFGFDPFCVSLVEGESVCLPVSWRSEVAAPFGAEAGG